ncbi:MAG: RNA-protein complex protein Nop10 [Candidatus Helarchaeota archaeon]|nr:RNA-protein complex protein Nop10 [Candidatus Helarchaeota archaeon]
MGKLLRKCVECGRYTMIESTCPQCGGKTVNPQPPKFSITDKYGKYRRELKKKVAESKKNSK